MIALVAFVCIGFQALKKIFWSSNQMRVIPKNALCGAFHMLSPVRVTLPRIKGKIEYHVTNTDPKLPAVREGTVRALWVAHAHRSVDLRVAGVC
jgi:hypothetical protein